MRRPTVLVADDHRLFADGLISLLKDHFDVVGAVSDGDQLVRQAILVRPDVIVSDVSMPTMTGIEALHHLKEHGVTSRVILLTMYGDARVAREALQSGAAGFVLKNSTGDELVTAIEEVLQARTYLSPALTKEVLALMSERADRPVVELTPRQREILRHIVAGRRMKEIASLLGISTRAAETVKYELMRTLDVHSTVDLVKYAIEHDLARL
jgi:DNA-binding NarL/FixJ family response regulator